MAKKYEALEKENCGMRLLGLFACFLTIISNYWEIGVSDTVFKGWLDYLKNFSTAVLLVVVSYALYRACKPVNVKKLLSYLGKMFYPIVVWAVIYWVIFILIDKFLEPGYSLKVKDLIWQIVTGSSQFLNPDMWVLNLFLIVSLVYMLISLISDKAGMAFMWILAVIMIIVRCFGIWGDFAGFSSYVRTLMNRLPETVVYMTAGLTLAHTNLLKDFKKHWLITQLAAVAILCLIRYVGLIGLSDKINLTLLTKALAAVTLTAFFYMIPFEYLALEAQRGLNTFFKPSLGIYAMQHLVAVLFHYFVSHRAINLETYTLLDSTIIFAICYVISFVLSKIPTRWIKMLVE